VYTAGKPDVVHTKAVSKAASETVLFFLSLHSFPFLICFLTAEAVLEIAFDLSPPPPTVVSFHQNGKTINTIFYVNIFYFTFLFDIRYIGEYNHQKSAHNYFPFHS
jgi:hypothetical protein